MRILPPCLYDLVGSAHAFHRLVQVLVKGITTIGGNHDIVGLVHCTHGILFHKGATLCMSRKHIASKDAGDLALDIEGHVQQEGWIGTQGNLAHFLPDGIPFNELPRSLWDGRSFQARDW